MVERRSKGSTSKSNRERVRVNESVDVSVLWGGVGVRWQEGERPRVIESSRADVSLRSRLSVL